MTITIPYHPGDTLEYKSRRYGKTTLIVQKVKMVWTKYGVPTVKYVGKPVYHDQPDRRWSTCVSISNSKTVTLIETKK